MRLSPVFGHLDLEGGEVVLKVDARGAVAALGVVDRPHVVLHTVLVCQLGRREVNKLIILAFKF